MSSIIAKVIEGFLTKLFDKILFLIIDWFKLEAKIDKNNEQIDGELKLVKESINVIKKKKENGEEITPEEIKRLKDANSRLSSGFFN